MPGHPSSRPGGVPVSASSNRRARSEAHWVGVGVLAVRDGDLDAVNVLVGLAWLC
ncbi:MAG: hypothetical protein ACRDRK_05110 [Pseudonocardia sp.]